MSFVFSRSLKYRDRGHRRLGLSASDLKNRHVQGRENESGVNEIVIYARGFVLQRPEFITGGDGRWIKLETYITCAEPGNTLRVAAAAKSLRLEAFCFGSCVCL
jgi:hypothetical protein